MSHTAHDPNLAHHFDTPQQQFSSAKLGMWIFLATEILMFGGLFCAYAVYRANHPDVFLYAHHYLDKNLGAINTIILLASSFTMAWGVRAAQKGQKGLLLVMLGLTLLGGVGFMGIKAVEYKHKWEKALWFGEDNLYHAGYKGEKKPGHGDPHAQPATAPSVVRQGPEVVDPLAGTPDAATLKPAFTHRPGLAPAAAATSHGVRYDDLGPLDRKRVNTFFSVYFVMTGLHGVHVLVGMGLIGWIFMRAARGEFGPKWFTPVDLVGLYWHIVDLIWIFLFPLLYLIH